MSWFQDLAGKAENILNQIDKNAANVLLKADDKKLSGSSGRSSDVRLDIQEDFVTNSDAVKTVKSSLNTSPKNVISMKRTTSSASMDGSRQTPEIIIERIGSSEQAYPITNSNSTSRRSSLSSRADLMSTSVVDEDEVKDNSSTMLTTSLNLGTAQIDSELENALSRLTYMQSRANAAELELDLARSELNNTNEKFRQNNIERDAKLVSLTQLAADVRQQLEWSKQEAEQAKIELAQYRSRAQSTLLMKDKIIEQLKSHSEPNHVTHPEDSVSTSSNLTLEHLRCENGNLLEDNQRLNEQLVSLRGHIDQMESAQKLQQDDFNLKLEEMSRNFRSEEFRLQDYETQNKVQIRELLLVREEMSRLQADNASQIHSK